MMSRAHTDICDLFTWNYGISFTSAFPQACLAVGKEDGEIALFTQTALRKSEGCFHKLRGHQRRVTSLTLSSSGQQQLLASGSVDNTVRLWDTHTRECVAVLKGHTDFVCSVAFSPDGRLLASTSDDRTVRLWDVIERQPIDVLCSHTNWMLSVSFSPDGRQLASGSYDNTVRLWSVPEGMPGPVLQHNHAVWCVAFSPVVGSNMLASASDDGIVRLWDVSGVIKRELHRHSKSFWSRSIAFSPDGSQLVSGSRDNAHLWSVASGKLLKKLGKGFSVAFHPNGKQVALVLLDKTMRMRTVCEWSDHTHQLFGEEMKRMVFCLVCIKDNIEKHTTIVPQLPMVLWLDIFAFLCDD
jgi:WD40 repeat protein